MREHLPDLDHLTDGEKDALIVELWEEIQQLRARVKEVEQRFAVLEAKGKEPPKRSQNSSVPPSQRRKGNRPEGKPKGMRREASVGRGGGGGELHPNPDQRVRAVAKVCPHCGVATVWASLLMMSGEACEQKVQAVYDKIELPPVKPIVTRVTQYGGRCGQCGQSYVAPVPVGLEGGSPFGMSVASLASYFRYTHAISYERRVGLCGDGFQREISEGALANLFEHVKMQLEGTPTAILERLRRSCLVCSDETSARVDGRNQWEGVFQNDEVCLQVIRPSRSARVSADTMGTHRPQMWVSDLYSSPKHHPAHHWQVGLAHQLRDCQYAIGAGDTLFAPRMKAVLLRALVIHKRRERWADSTLYPYRCELRRRLEAALNLHPTPPHGIRLQKRYAALKEHRFLFLEEASIPQPLIQD